MVEEQEEVWGHLSKLIKEKVVEEVPATYRLKKEKPESPRV